MRSISVNTHSNRISALPVPGYSNDLPSTNEKLPARAFYYAYGSGYPHPHLIL
jgi:hypothetical protein